MINNGGFETDGTKCHFYFHSRNGGLKTSTKNSLELPATIHFVVVRCRGRTPSEFIGHVQTAWI